MEGEGEGTWEPLAVTAEGFSAEVREWERSGKCSWQLCLGLQGYEVNFMPIISCPSENTFLASKLLRQLLPETELEARL